MTDTTAGQAQEPAQEPAPEAPSGDAAPITFQETLRADVRDIFLNAAEFAGPHVVDGLTVTALLDETCAGLDSGAGGGFADASSLGLLRADCVLYASAAALPRPHPDQQLMVDGRLYAVTDASDQDGLLRIGLQRAYA